MMQMASDTLYTKIHLGGGLQISWPLAGLKEVVRMSQVNCMTGRQREWAGSCLAHIGMTDKKQLELYQGILPLSGAEWLARAVSLLGRVSPC